MKNYYAKLLTTTSLVMASSITSQVSAVEREPESRQVLQHQSIWTVPKNIDQQLSITQGFKRPHKARSSILESMTKSFGIRAHAARAAMAHATEIAFDAVHSAATVISDGFKAMTHTIETPVSPSRSEEDDLGFMGLTEKLRDKEKHNAEARAKMSDAVGETVKARVPIPAIIVDFFANVSGIGITESIASGSGELGEASA